MTPAPLVLIVEDDPQTRQFFQTIFELHGFRTEQAHNGLQAFQKAVDVGPDLIVTDIVVPGIDGLELCRRLRADVRTRAIPVIAVTGYADREYPDRAREAGADRVIIKPCKGDLLIGEARQLLETGRAFAEASAGGEPWD